MAISGTFRKGLAALFLLSAITGCSDETGPEQSESDLTAGQRPPQYVMLAFDGSKSLSFWESSRAFARDSNVRFTYFISGVYFVDDAHKSVYQGPRRSAGPARSQR